MTGDPSQLLDDAAEHEEKAASFGFSGDKGRRALQRACKAYLGAFRTIEQYTAKLGGLGSQQDALKWSSFVQIAVEALGSVARCYHRLASTPAPASPPSLSLRLLLLAVQCSRMALTSASNHKAAATGSNIVLPPIPTTDMKFNLAQQLRDLADAVSDDDVAVTLPSNEGMLPDPAQLSREAVELLSDVYVAQREAIVEQERSGWKFDSDVVQGGVSDSSMDPAGAPRPSDVELPDPITPLTLHDTLVAFAGATGDCLLYASEIAPVAIPASLISEPDQPNSNKVTLTNAAELGSVAIRAVQQALSLVPSSPEAVLQGTSLASQIAEATEDAPGLERAAAELESAAGSFDALIASAAQNDGFSSSPLSPAELRSAAAEALSTRGDVLLTLIRLVQRANSLPNKQLRALLSSAVQSYSRALSYSLPPPSPFSQPVPLSCCSLLLRCADSELMRAASGLFTSQEVGSIVKNAASYVTRAEKCARDGTELWRVPRKGQMASNDPLAAPSLYDGGYVSDSDALLAKCSFAMLRCISFQVAVNSGTAEDFRVAGTALVTDLRTRTLPGATWEQLRERAGPDEEVGPRYWGAFGDTDGELVARFMWTNAQGT
ncbi:hypothetical protein M427DRAFT_40281 [Gonapodya prolifera JEL478]|uniref:Uncharacterized protein n=1 Tax=Gonapodya prolifera (strain JEL478) TaxID=1344416 RepID=A0A139B0R7_GONPJ|nr:hypothetical protein M427DRAFT_40281 [Gonapodya prolifera JEL478]|eukprot:KXS22393.1 hypothetical protein M427DRAFT_40281 [Gonapodya prolifera JEL478]